MQLASIPRPQQGCGDSASFYRLHPGTRLWADEHGLTVKGRELAAALPSRNLPSGTTLEMSLSAAFLDYVAQLTSEAQQNTIYVDRALRPMPPCPSELLESAASAPSVRALLEQRRAPNIVARAIAGQLHGPALANGASELESDLATARTMGVIRRAILVDTTSARLWTIDGEHVTATMKVIVGKAGSETPQMAALIRFAQLDPYWDVPPDLVRRDLAPRLAAAGSEFLVERDMETVDRYGPGAKLLDPDTINWNAVRSGGEQVGIRQIPGPGNMMGRVLFMFPNAQGIYLHDTPLRRMFGLRDRQLSNGCVRLERAADLYQWAFGTPLPPSDPTAPARRVDLAEPIPVYLLHFSAQGSTVLGKALAHASPSDRHSA